MIVMKTYVSRSILKTTSFVLHLVYTNLEETLRLLGIRFVVSYIGCDKQEKSLSYPLCPGFGVHSNSGSISIAILQIPSKGKIPRSAVENAVSIRHPFFFVCKCYDSIFVIGSIHSSCTIKCVIIHRYDNSIAIMRTSDFVHNYAIDNNNMEDIGKSTQIH